MYATEGKPAESPALLSLVTLFQFTENLSDRQAAATVVKRIDWKYALHLPLTDDGFDFSVLCEFRQSLLTYHAEGLVFDQLRITLSSINFLILPIEALRLPTQQGPQERVLQRTPVQQIVVSTKTHVKSQSFVENQVLDLGIFQLQ